MPGATGAMRFEVAVAEAERRSRRDGQIRVQVPGPRACGCWLPALRRGADGPVDALLAYPLPAGPSSESSHRCLTGANPRGPCRADHREARLQKNDVIVRRHIASPDHDAAILIAELEAPNPNSVVRDERAAERKRGLLTIERQDRPRRRSSVAGSACQLWSRERARRTVDGSLPERVTTLITDDAERPRSAENRLVATWNSCTASCEMFFNGPPTTSSLLSMPSMVMLPPRPN